MNLVLVIVDDMSLSHLRYLQGAVAALASHGHHLLRFRRAYTTSPVCCPSRASLFRSQYAHHHGIRFNREIPPGTLNGGARAFKELGLEESTLAVWLERAGYVTHLVGKYLNGYENVEPAGHIPPGWVNWRAIYELGSGYYDYTLAENGRLVSYGDSPSDYMTDVLGRLAVRGVRQTPTDRPLFLLFAPYAPHKPGIPANRHAGLLPHLQAPRNPAYAEADVRDKPAWVRGLTWTQEKVDQSDEWYAGGARSLLAVDEAIVSIVEELAATGRIEDTFFLFMNDNGFSYGEHRWLEKTSPYEACVRVPLFASSADPALIPATEQRDQLLAIIDVAPTLAELASATPEHDVDGVSFASLLPSAAAAVRSELLIERWSPNDVGTPSNPIPTFDGIVTPGWKYVELFTGERELYPISQSRFELENLANAPHTTFVREFLANRLEALRSS